MIVVTLIVIKYSKQIYELHSLLFFQRINGVYEFMAYPASILELICRKHQSILFLKPWVV